MKECADFIVDICADEEQQIADEIEQIEHDEAALSQSH